MIERNVWTFEIFAQDYSWISKICQHTFYLFLNFSEVIVLIFSELLEIDQENSSIKLSCFYLIDWLDKVDI
jgi:hypothetical protein